MYTTETVYYRFCFIIRVINLHRTFPLCAINVRCIVNKSFLASLVIEKTQEDTDISEHSHSVK